MVSSAGNSDLIQFCIQWSSVALLYYDYVLTFNLEVQYIWTKKFRISTVLYFCCRYSLVANVVYLLTITNEITAHDCRSGYLVSSALSVVGRAAIIVVWTARAFAVFGKNRWILLCFGSLGLMIVILDIMDVLNNTCSGNKKSSLIRTLVIVTMCVFEFLSAVLTTFRSIQALSVNGPWWKQKRCFTYLVLEQGVLYFCVVAVLTISSLVLNFTIHGGFLQRLLNAHTMPLSGLMTARFLLHLRKWQATESSPDGYVQEHEHDGSERTHPLDVLVFSDPTRTTYGESDSDSELGLPQSGSASMSFVDQFGEDPVRRARAISGADFGYSRGDIVEESRV